MSDILTREQVERHREFHLASPADRLVVLCCATALHYMDEVARLKAERRALVERAVEAGVQWEAYHPGCGYRGAASLAARVLEDWRHIR